MFSVSYANLVNYFYPIGNTPAVSLTQALPKNLPAKVLLLGCGDVRHMLFTLHTDPRQLDITACDLQPAIVARNVFLLTLLIKDSNRRYEKSYWNLYFHFKIDDTSLGCLRDHAKYLCSLSVTLQDWTRSELGRFITFCDESSLRKTREIWLFWSNWTSKDQLDFEDSLQKSRGFKTMRGEGVNITALRSASPVFANALNDLPDLHSHYWKHGTTETEPKQIALASHLNPMFALPSADQILHYGADPLLGFHLAIAYMPPAADSVPPQKIVEAAKEEFASWVNSFRANFRESLFVRFFVGDAIAFSYQLQNARTSPGHEHAHFYCDRAHFEPLVLGDDYCSGGSAPKLFDVIDTSNLADHIGALNLLTAAAPLLKNDVSATLYTERLLKLAETRTELVEDLIGGDLPTLSMLLGLVSVEMATGASTTYFGNESMIDMIIDSTDEGNPRVKQRFIRLAWKRPISTSRPPLSPFVLNKIKFNAVDLGSVLYSVYLTMFQEEDVTSLMLGLKAGNVPTPDQFATILHRRSVPNYHRASFAAFLRFVKSRVHTDWNISVSKLLTLMESNSAYMMSRNYLQELYTWLYIQDIYTVNVLAASPSRATEHATPGDLSSWKDVPPIVCITLEVPRENLQVLATKEKPLGTYPLHSSVRSPLDHPQQYENHFSALQIGFGTVCTRGTRFDSSFEVEITEDGSAWSGQLPLLVSFYVPTWILLLEPRKTVLTFGIYSTPQTTQEFLSQLGPTLTVFSTSLNDLAHVYVSERLPNLLTKPTICDPESNLRPQHDMSDISKSTLTASMSPDVGKITSLTNRVDLRGQLSAILRTGCEVHLHSQSPFNYEVQLGGKDHSFILDFPIPVEQSNIRTKIARKSSYIELVANIEPKAPPLGSFAYPLLQTSSSPILWNLPYLNLGTQPSLDISEPKRLAWLNTHVSMMFSARQRHLRKDPVLPASAQERVVVELKDSLLSLFMHYSGVQVRKAKIFGITCPDAGGVHILLLASRLRLDLSNRSLVVDAAALPLHDDLMPQVSPYLHSLNEKGGLCQIKASEPEMRLWKHLLPSWVERCRTWNHKATCEYTVAGRIPLSVDNGQRCLCSCGNGDFPTGYLQGASAWHGILQYAVRIAISPFFYSSLVDDAFPNGKTPKMCQSCGRCDLDLKHCAGCQRVHYCSTECQRKDWKAHKADCKTRPSTAE